MRNPEPPPERRPTVVGHLAFWWLVMGGVAAAVAFGGTAHPLRATYVFGASLVGGSVLRLVLPQELSGGLVVRARWVDALTLAALGVAVVVIGRLMNLHPQI